MEGQSFISDYPLKYTVAMTLPCKGIYSCKAPTSDLTLNSSIYMGIWQESCIQNQNDIGMSLGNIAYMVYVQDQQSPD